MIPTTKHNAIKLVATLLAGAILVSASPVRAAWKPVSPDSTLERVRIMVVSEQGPEVPLRGIWTVLEPNGEADLTLAGTGRVRVEIRPVYADRGDDDSFRLGVTLADTLRKFHRHSAWEFNVRFQLGDSPRPGESRTIVGLGEADRLDLDWVAGTDRLAIRNRSRHGRRLLVRILLGEGVTKVTLGTTAPIATTPDRSWGFEAGVPRLGWDSNAFLTAKSDSGAEAKWFLPAEIRANLERDLGSRTVWQARYRFKGAFYDKSVLNEFRHQIDLRGTSRLGSQKPRRGVDVFYGYRFTHKNDTYNARGDREEFETIDPGTGQAVPLGNRFDYNEHRITGGLRKYLGRRVVITATAKNRYKNYIEDYAAYADIYALDQSQLDLAAKITWRLRRDFVLSAAWDGYDRDYDEKFARDQDGVELPGTPSSLRYNSWVLLADYGRGTGLRADAELKSFSSSDLHAGYWDYTGTAFEIGAGWRWPAGHRLRASLRYSAKDYQQAHLDHDPLQPLREKNFLNVKVKADYLVNRSWEAIFRYHYKDADNNNDPFAYTRAVVVVGMTYRR